jgi:hypothetical protein
MHATSNSDFRTGPMSACAPHCPRKQARELLEGLRIAYQSLRPAEWIMIRCMISQVARTQFAPEPVGTGL